MNVSRAITALLLIFSLLGCKARQETAQTPAVSSQTALVSTQQVNCRATPSPEAEITDQFTKGTTIKVLSVSGEWTQVAFKNAPCWVKSNFITSSASPVTGDFLEQNVEIGEIVSPENLGSNIKFLERKFHLVYASHESEAICRNSSCGEGELRETEKRYYEVGGCMTFITFTKDDGGVFEIGIDSLDAGNCHFKYGRFDTDTTRLRNLQDEGNAQAFAMLNPGNVESAWLLTIRIEGVHADGFVDQTFEFDGDDGGWRHAVCQAAIGEDYCEEEGQELLERDGDKYTNLAFQMWENNKPVSFMISRY